MKEKYKNWFKRLVWKLNFQFNQDENSFQRRVKVLPRGNKLSTMRRYEVIIRCIENVDKLYFWETKRKRMLESICNKAIG